MLKIPQLRGGLVRASSSSSSCRWASSSWCRCSCRSPSGSRPSRPASGCSHSRSRSCSPPSASRSSSRRHPPAGGAVRVPHPARRDRRAHRRCSTSAPGPRSSPGRCSSPGSASARWHPSSARSPCRAVPDEQTDEVGGLQNTVTNLGASIGTALAGAVLIAALTTRSSPGSRTTPTSAELSRPGRGRAVERRPVRVRRAARGRARRAGVRRGTADAIVDENAEARIDGLRAALAVLALIAVGALLSTRRIPTISPVLRGPSRPDNDAQCSSTWRRSWMRRTNCVRSSMVAARIPIATARRTPASATSTPADRTGRRVDDRADERTIGAAGLGHARPAAHRQRAARGPRPRPGRLSAWPGSTGPWPRWWPPWAARRWWGWSVRCERPSTVPARRQPRGRRGPCVAGGCVAGGTVVGAGVAGGGVAGGSVATGTAGLTVTGGAVVGVVGAGVTVEGGPPGPLPPPFPLPGPGPPPLLPPQTSHPYNQARKSHHDWPGACAGVENVRVRQCQHPG